MQLKQKQQIAQKQTQKLSLYQRQSLEILSLDAHSLNELISEVEQQNPLIETDWSVTTTSSDYFYEKKLASTDDINIDLRLQFHLFTTDKKIRLIGDYLLNTLDEHGYLNCSVAEVATALDTHPGYVKLAIGVLQSLEPAGVGARSIQESLLLQLKRQREANPLSLQIIEEFFNELAEKKYLTIAQSLSVSKDSVREAIKEIQALNPYPMDNEPQVNTHCIHPELLVYVKDERVNVTMMQRLPTISVNRLPPTKELDAKDWVNQYMNEANSLISAISRRQNTLLCIGRAIVANQSGFFLESKPPCSLKQETLADELHLSTSTISRAVSGQYLQFERRIFPLKYFFPPSIVDGASREEIKAVIKRLIDNEDPVHPISDEKISHYLSTFGQAVNRRTVTKYRQELAIPAIGERFFWGCS